MTQKLTAREQRYRRLANKLVKAVDPTYRIVWYATATSPYRPNQLWSDWNREDASDEDAFSWDGRTLTFSEGDPALAMHDVAHLLLCSARRRRVPEFGLGPDPSNWQSAAKRTISHASALREESLTCSLQWCIAAYVGGHQDADEVAKYVNIQRYPTRRTIEGFARRFPMLPPTFTRRVLAVRDICRRLDTERGFQ